MTVPITPIYQAVLYSGLDHAPDSACHVREVYYRDLGRGRPEPIMDGVRPIDSIRRLLSKRYAKVGGLPARSNTHAILADGRLVVYGDVRGIWTYDLHMDTVDGEPVRTAAEAAVLYTPWDPATPQL